jgi:vacuolar protein sorting-associated protein 13B
VVVEQLEPLYEVPEIPAFGMTHYELPIMREWFEASSEVHQIPNIHIQGLYNVTVADISEDSEARISQGQTTEVPQGWSYGFDINTTGHFVVNLPGRGRVIVFVCKSRLCTVVRIQMYDENAAIVLPPSDPSCQFCDVVVNVFKLDISLVNAHKDLRKPSEVLRTTIFGITLCNSPLIEHMDGKVNLSELALTLNSFQLDNQLEGELFQFPVVLMANESYSKTHNTSSQRKPRIGSCMKPFLSIKLQYEPNSKGPFLHSVLVSCEPVTVFLEDTLVYRMAVLAESFLPPTQECDILINTASHETRLLLNECTSILNPLVIGEFKIKPLTIHLTLHASAKLFIAMDDTSLSLGQLHICPVYAPASMFAQKVFYHYMSSVMFKIGWVVGSLELLGNPAGLIRNFSQGLADFFFLPYDGLTRGPGAFVSGMSQGVSSFVRHVSTGALTSVTNLASSISRNLDRLCMDEDHIRLQEEQRCRRPTRLITG